MPEITAIHIVLLATSTVIGAAVAWVLRGNRAEQEKAAVTAGWQEQMDAQRREHDRLVDQNKSLMEQISQYQASNTDAKNRARELSTALQETFERRDELQREIKDIRNNLEVALTERKQLQSDIESRVTDQDLLHEKDERIARLSRELDSWQNRLPPLIEKFRVRNEEAERLETELGEARARIAELETAQSQETRIEPVRDPEELTDGLDASNDPDESDDEIVPEAAPGDAEAAVDDAGPEPEPEPQPEAKPQPEPVAAFSAFGDRDDLKQIKGVGPAIEKTLNELGIFSFQQIADMSEYDIDRVARKLKGFHSRIYREDWIGQARELLERAAHA